MTDFKKLFSEDKSKVYPQMINYKDKTVFLVDKFHVTNKDVLIISIENTNSKYVQGVSVGIYGSCKVLGERHKKGKFLNMFFWENSEALDKEHIELQVFTKDNFVFIQNIWEAESSPPFVFKEGEKHPCYVGTAEWHSTNRWNGAAMCSEEIERGKRYFCNDGDLDDDFDDIVFTVQKL